MVVPDAPGRVSARDRLARQWAGGVVALDDVGDLCHRVEAVGVGAVDLFDEDTERAAVAATRERRVGEHVDQAAAADGVGDIACRSSGQSAASPATNDNDP